MIIKFICLCVYLLKDWCRKYFVVLFLEKYIANISIKYSIIMDDDAKCTYPGMDLVLSLYRRYFQCKADRLVVMFHFLMIQKGYKLFDKDGQVCPFILERKIWIFFWIGNI